MLPWSKLTLIADKGFESGKPQRELFNQLNLSFAPMRRKKKYNVSPYTEKIIEEEEKLRKDYNAWIKKLRYVVELTFSWLNRCRGLVRCYERTLVCHTQFCTLAAICLGLKRLNF